MLTIERYQNPVRAELAAGYLRSHGVLAKVVGQMDTLGGISPSLAPRGQFELIIADRADEEEARLLLEEFDEDPPRDPGWEGMGSEPDLGRLDESLAPGCPSCGHRLALDASVQRCEGCGVEVDVAELLVSAHGPEVLDGCYPDTIEEIPESLIERAPLGCPGCRGSLYGLDSSGRCPRCGTAYDKRALIQAFLDHPNAG